MEKKPEGDQNNQSNPTEGTKPATPGKLPTFFYSEDEYCGSK